MSLQSSIVPNPASGLILANLICIASMLIWAAGLPAADVLIPILPPIELSALRMVLATAFLLPFWALSEGLHPLRQANWGRGVLVGAFIGLGALLLVLGQARSDPVTVAIIGAAMPVVGITLEVVFDGRPITLALILGLALSLVGGIVALDLGSGDLSLGLGAALCFGSVVSFTLGSRLTVTGFPGISPIGRTTVTLAGATLVLVLASAANIGVAGGAMPALGSFGLREWGALLLFAVGSLGISQVLWIHSVGKLGIGLSSLHMNATPFYVMLILFVLGDAWIWLQFWGALIVGLGVLVAQGIMPLGRK